MRLIDADALDYNRLPAYYGDSVREDDVKDWIADAPTIDAAPVVHAAWIRMPFSECNSYCSACKWVWKNKRIRAKYCLSCGAKMDAKEAES